MIVGVIIKEAVGLLVIVLGLVLWIKRKVSILHDYHYKNVKQEDIPAYTRLMGIGLIFVGLGIGVSGVLDLIYSVWWWTPLVVGFVSGFTVIIIAQKKYNGSIFG